MKTRIAIFASGSGTNAEQIMKYFSDHPNIEVASLLSNKKEAGVLERARMFEVETMVFKKEEFRDDTSVLDWLKERQVDVIVLAGFLLLVPSYFVSAFKGRMINIHPALLPKYGGKGMFGIHVHEAVKAAGDSETGITIHMVNEHFDEGEIVFQTKCEISGSDSPDDIADKVHELEHQHFPRVIEEWINTLK
ncbi:MAG: phosphoribosylglycinamide formyltransferase [Bacteroidetes bacterium]|nr:phosphoribosylglycinamide formyltransferase [Bacteroidota bacterium]